MKRVVPIVFSLFFLTILSSCNKDMEETDNIVTGFVTVWTDTEGKVTVLQDDFGNRYMANDKDNHKAPADTMLRVISLYTINADSTIATVLETINILSNRATDISECENNEIKQDPVEVQSVWVSGGYLNAVIGISVHNIPHILFMVADTTQNNSLTFSLYHDRNADPLGATRNAYISVPLDGYGLEKGDSIFFSCKEDGAVYNSSFEF